MDIIVTEVYDTLRFTCFMCIKYNYSPSYVYAIIKSINKYGPIKFYNLLECEVRYLQRNYLEYGKYFVAIHKPICKLKITNMENVKSIPSYLDVERESLKQKAENSHKSCIDISPQPSDEPTQDTSELFHVKFIKVIYCNEMLNEKQIQALLKDKHVKSINIEK